MLRQALRESKKLRICCDIDGVLASKTLGNDYTKAQPVENNIHILNALYEQGFHIVLFTARGYKSGLDWRDVTARQMDKWNVHYHELLFGKPDADVYIDDKLFNISELGSITMKQNLPGSQKSAD